MRMLSELDYVSVADLKARLSEKLKFVEGKNRRLAVTSHGRPRAVLISYMEYIALTEKSGDDKAKEIPIEEWQKGRAARKRVIDKIAGLFDETGLTRKGQKGYKKDAVKKMGKIK